MARFGAVGITREHVVAGVRVDQHACLVQHLIRRVDRNLRPDRKRHRIARATVNLDVLLAMTHDDLREKRVVFEIGDDNVANLAAEFRNDGVQEIVRQGARNANVLHLDGDGFSLRRADPDDETALSRFLLENHDALVAVEAHADPVDCHLDHVPTSPRTLASIVRPLARWDKPKICPWPSTRKAVARAVLSLDHIDACVELVPYVIDVRNDQNQAVVEDRVVPEF